MLKARGAAHIFPGAGELLDVNSKKIVRKLTRDKGNALVFSLAKTLLEEMWEGAQDWKSKLISE